MINDLQPALIDASSEFFDINISTRFKLSDGSLSTISGLPEYFLNLLEQELQNDRLAQRGLVKLDITSKSSQLEKMYLCNFSASDSNPDVTLDGKLGCREFVRCSERGKCKAEGLLCKFPDGLSKREIEVANLIAQGHADDLICYELDLSIHTLRNHKNNIEGKIGKQGKPAIAAWAVQNNIISI